MTTFDILNLDCTNQENVIKLNRFLYNIKPITKMSGNDKTKQVTIETLEKTMHGLCIKYGYLIQGIAPYYEEDRFVFFTTCVMTKSDRKWLGNVYGKTMWETLAKICIKIYAEILKERKNNG